MKHINLPQKRNREFYQACQRQFIKLTRSFPDIVSVYSAGTVAHPGISDLDFVLCLKNKLQQPLDIEERLSDDLRQVIGHGSILKINESNIRNIKIIDDFPLKRLTGKDYAFIEYASPLFELCRALDWLPERLFRLAALAASDTYDAMRALQLFKSVTISLKKVALLTGSTAYQPFAQAVEQLRRRWFRYSNAEKKLDTLLRQSIEVCKNALNELDDYVRQKGLITPSRTQTLFSIAHGPQWRFARSATVQGKTVFMPYTVSVFLAAQAASSNQFMAKQVRSSFRKLPKAAVHDFVQPELLTIINHRMAYVESVAAFFRENHLTKGLLKYGWFL